MTTQAALDYIHYSMTNDQEHINIRALGAEAKLDEVVQLGLENGFEFSIDELKQAFKIDWQMRANYYSSLSG